MGTQEEASKGAPGLAFETWDPSNQSRMENPTLTFVIPSEAEGSAVPGPFVEMFFDRAHPDFLLRGAGHGHVRGFR